MMRLHYYDRFGLAFLVIDDNRRTHDLLKNRESPRIELELEDAVAHAAKLVIDGKQTAEDLLPFLLAYHPIVKGSRWRQELLREWFSHVMPYDQDAKILEAMGHI
jgi:hypothetical protein